MPLTSSANLLAYLMTKLNNPTPMKLNKCAYYCYAYYGVVYGQAKEYPGLLFKNKFISGKYGPRLRNNVNVIKQAKAKKNIKDREILDALFSTMLFAEIVDECDKTPDFWLMNDSAKDKFATEKPGAVIEPNVIIETYREKLTLHGQLLGVKTRACNWPLVSKN